MYCTFRYVGYFFIDLRCNRSCGFVELRRAQPILFFDFDSRKPMNKHETKNTYFSHSTVVDSFQYCYRLLLEEKYSYTYYILHIIALHRTWVGLCGIPPDLYVGKSNYRVIHLHPVDKRHNFFITYFVPVSFHLLLQCLRKYSLIKLQFPYRKQFINYYHRWLTTCILNKV